MNVTACLVTRGDVDMQPILDSLPAEWEVVLWVNGSRLSIWRQAGEQIIDRPVPDLSVYGRYAAIEYASNDLIYVQDDDVIVSDPQAIVDEYIDEGTHMHDVFGEGLTTYFEAPDLVVCNMPSEFRPHYPDSALVGFGAAFHRDAPTRAFDRFHEASYEYPFEMFQRTCDVVFTTLTPRVLVDVPKQDREMASDANRMWKQPNHLKERTEMLRLARMVRDDA